MVNKKDILVVSLVVITVIIFVAFLQKNRWYSKSDIAKHPDSNSCWTSINGKIYNLTSLVGTHSGGRSNILLVCGKDGSAVFNKRHGDETEPISDLQTYKIGILR
ncbi:hypothetical protein BH10PAT1_BH10PAT1_3480 [soil metagenome]